MAIGLCVVEYDRSILGVATELQCLLAGKLFYSQRACLGKSLGSIYWRETAFVFPTIISDSAFLSRMWSRNI